MSIKVSMADLTHTGQLVAANTFPLGISYVASYANAELGEEIDLQIFKYPEDFSSYLESNTPQIACFSAFSWNLRLGHEYARRIKEASPNTITVFGGPNFPSTGAEQREFLSKFPAMDCYFEFEGEIPFVEFFNTLKTLDFQWEKFKEAKTVVSNIRYLADGQMITGSLAAKIKEMNVLPSPYFSGLMDKFFDDVLIPMIQTTRGCPYTCAFCWEGGDYFQKTNRFPQDRISDELHYIAKRVEHIPDVVITDSNFGMFKEDLQTARVISEIKQTHKHGWPKSVLAATAKNHKERTIEIVEMLGDTMPPTAAVQSTDGEVLDQIRRKNVPLETLIILAQATAKHGGQSEAEIILCLEGDSKTAHFKTVCDMLDAEMTFLRMYQFMMLPGTQSASREIRQKYGFDTRYRVLPRCFGTYTFRGEAFPVAEIEEIVIANTTMPYEDYQACRDLHLTVEIFHNDSIFFELTQFLIRRGVPRSQFILKVHEQIVNGDGVLFDLYRDFRKEEQRNLRHSVDDLETFTLEPSVMDRYLDGEYGTNELYKYRALAVFRHIEALHDIAFGVARNLLQQRELLHGEADFYLAELHDFSLIRKRDLFDSNRTIQRNFHFDFVKLMNDGFTTDPLEATCPEGVDVEVYHSEQQSELIDGYVKQYGTTLIGLGRILIRANMNRLYRSARTLASTEPAEAQDQVRISQRGHHHLIE